MDWTTFGALAGVIVVVAALQCLLFLAAAQGIAQAEAERWRRAHLADAELLERTTQLGVEVTQLGTQVADLTAQTTEIARWEAGQTDRTATLQTNVQALATGMAEVLTRLKPPPPPENRTRRGPAPRGGPS